MNEMNDNNMQFEKRVRRIKSQPHEPKKNKTNIPFPKNISFILTHPILKFSYHFTNLQSRI